MSTPFWHTHRCTHPQQSIPLFLPPEGDVGTVDHCGLYPMGVLLTAPMTCYGNVKQGGNQAHEGSRATTGNS